VTGSADVASPDGEPLPSTTLTGSHRSRRRRLAATLGVLAAGLAVVVAILLWHYLPYADSARALMARATDLSAEVRALGVQDLHTTTIDRLSSEMDSLQAEIVPLQGLLATDPLVGLVRSLPVVGTQVRGVDALMTASDELVAGGQVGLGVGRQVAAISDHHGSSAAGGMLPALVSVMATSTAQIDDLAAHLERARTALAAIPGNAIGPVAHARDQLIQPLDSYGTVLDEYRQMDSILPAILGWQAGKRYLVLALDPAELRATGGYAGTVGTIAFQDGSLTERHFFDVFTLDTKPGLPYVEPPDGLREHLLGDLPWTLADANWSPDFPTSAQDALRLYTLESGDDHIDGVIALTTYALDRLLEVTGPITVPGYDQVVKAGDVTLTALQLTRASTDPSTNRKQFLDALANTVLDRLFQLPQASWLPMFQAVQGIGQDRLAMAWFKDPAAEALMERLGWSGEVRQDPGDYVYAVDSNVAPTSKYNLVVERSSYLGVTLDTDQAATTTLRLDWANHADQAGQPYEFLRSASTSTTGMYGVWVRVLMPNDATLLAASGQSAVPVSGVEYTGEEAGRAVVGNFLLIAPGTANMTYQWSSPGVVTRDGDDWVYRLTIQKQPGQGPEPITLRLALPDGATMVRSSDGLEVSGQHLAYTGTMTADLTFEVRYRLP